MSEIKNDVASAVLEDPSAPIPPPIEKSDEQSMALIQDIMEAL